MTTRIGASVGKQFDLIVGRRGAVDGHGDVKAGTRCRHIAEHRKVLQAIGSGIGVTGVIAGHAVGG